MAPRPNQGHPRPTGDLGAMSLSHLYLGPRFGGRSGSSTSAAQKKSPARPEMAPSTRDKALRCKPATWEGLGGLPHRRGAPGLQYGAYIRTIHPTRAVRRSSSLCWGQFLALPFCSKTESPSSRWRLSVNRSSMETHENCQTQRGNVAPKW